MLNQAIEANKSAQLLALYIDCMMSKEHPHSKKKELVQSIKQTKIDLIISVFRFLHSKDMFEESYNRYLSKRLIHKKSESYD